MAKKKTFKRGSVLHITEDDCTDLCIMVKYGKKTSVIAKLNKHGRVDAILEVATKLIARIDPNDVDFDTSNNINISL